MSSNRKRRERYAQDETYRDRQLRAVRERRENQKRWREQVKRLRGWKLISSVPENEIVLIYDPVIFWPIVAKLKDHRWQCLHYQGPAPRPTHWKHIDQVPLA